MLTEEVVVRKAGFDLSTSLFVLALLVMALCEAYAIQGVLFRHIAFAGRVRGKELPYLIWIPAFFAIMVRVDIAKRMRRFEIRPSVAAYFNGWLGGVLLIAYLLIARLAEIIYG
jgi:hypothetical protein